MTTAKHLKAVILLAGEGTRLWPTTFDTPKSLLQIGQKPLLWYSLDNLLKTGVSDLCFVVGFQAGKIKKFIQDFFPNLPIKYVYNEKCHSTNSIYSYFLATSFFRNTDFFRLEGDLLYNRNILNALLRSQKTIVSAVEKKFKKYKEEYSVSVNLKTKTILKYGKDIPTNEAFGEAKGIEFISTKSSLLVASSLNELIARGRTDEYAEVVYQNLINQHYPMSYQLLGKKDFWCEVDTYQDYINAQKNLDKIYAK